MKIPGLDDPPLVTIERGCTSETDDNLYKCETSEDGSRLEAPSDLFLNNKISINNNNERSCNCKSSGCNSDWASADNIACYVCDSSDGIECDAEHQGEEVKRNVELKRVYSESCFECYPAILPQAKCWHPLNRGCYISESETRISPFVVLVI